nr:hypothetical protein [Tanacetum cinerariifolium]
FDQIEPPDYSINPSLNIQSEPDAHELFINSLRMGDEHLDTIPETESDEFIKYSVKNLVPNLSESEDLSGKNLFKSSFDEEIISIKIYPHPFNAESDLIESLLNHDFSIISSSSKIDSLLDEFAGELTLLKSIPSGIDENDCDPEEEIRLIEKLLYDNSSPPDCDPEEEIRLIKKLLYDNSSPRPLEEFIFENSDATIESFSPSPIPVEDNDSLRDEIDLSLTPDDSMPPSIEDDDYDSEGDILEELLSNDSLLLPKNEGNRVKLSDPKQALRGRHPL